MSLERQESKVNRRTILRWGAFGAAGITGVDLQYRNFVVPIREENQRHALSKALWAKAEAIYPSIPSLDVSILSKSSDEIAKVQQRSVTTGYDEEGKPIELPFLEGEELIKALGYPDKELDNSYYLNIEGLRDRNGQLNPTKSDGTSWTLRERILYRPELYNEYLRRRINGRNMDKKAAWYNTKMPPEPAEDPSRSFKNNLEFLVLLSPAIIRLAIKSAKKIKEEIRRGEYEEKRRRIREEVEEREWKKTYEKMHDEYQRIYDEYQRAQNQSSAQEIRHESTINPKSFFQTLGINLDDLKELPVDQRRHRVSEIRKGIALLLKEGDLDLWGKLNSQLDKVDPKFDKKPSQTKTDGARSTDKQERSTQNNNDIAII